jgi:hypothetical protein
LVGVTKKKEEKADKTTKDNKKTEKNEEKKWVFLLAVMKKTPI